MGQFDGIENAEARRDRSYLEPGIYLLEIQNITAGRTSGKKAPAEDFFAVEAKVLESNNPAIPVGHLINWWVGTERVAGLDNVKSFVVALENCAPAEVTGDAVEALCSAQQPAVGQKVRCSVVGHETKRGLMFNKHNWSVA